MCRDDWVDYLNSLQQDDIEEEEVPTEFINIEEPEESNETEEVYDDEGGYFYRTEVSDDYELGYID